ncbi:exodeoxyribonuclease III [Cellulomonas sp. PhB143]|uniref:exodeoxyribonuclease III n=1 Tax=Cellulomonas sp. PhB143 TaxID=2485186 RepID=UPI000FA96F73|nr:exodeoxyribonuclease III [Cellulomonas sp. PhB143]ROS76842.1 exodeoxyribonuclease-3 [Cellulomonas sp. PhB143]
MAPVLTIATVNVNGIRAAVRRGMDTWIARRTPDVLLLQEVRAPDDVLHGLLDGWHVAHQASEVKGRAGVVVASRLPLSAVRVGLGSDAEDAVDTGRWVEADVELPDGGAVTAVSAYLHSGTVAKPETMTAKYAHLDRVTTRMRELAADDRLAVVAGDVNIAHHEVDIKNWRGNRTAAGFLPRERAYLDTWLDELGYADLGRRFGGEGPGPYTWWSWRGKAFDNDSGWRIDYQLATPALAERAVKVEVDRAETYDARFSDHAPVVATYDL